MTFIVTLLKGWLPVKQRALSWMLQGPIYTYECYKYITVRKNSSPNELWLSLNFGEKEKNTLPKTRGSGILIKSLK